MEKLEMVKRKRNAVSVPPETIAHCMKHPGCAKCPLIDGCVAPHSAKWGSDDFNQWVTKMNRRVMGLTEAQNDDR